MRFILLIAFIGIPSIEIALFIEVGDLIGVWPTIAMVILTAMAGTVLLRIQGLGALADLQESLRQGVFPLASVFDGFCLLVAGMLLLTPGFFTDALGFLLFTPPLRHALKRFLSRRFPDPDLMNADPHGGPSGPFGPGHVIDGEFQDISEPRKPDGTNNRLK